MASQREVKHGFFKTMSIHFIVSIMRLYDALVKYRGILFYAEID
jgi:hypothetical protein